jgi:hypothetical protein
MGLVVICFLAVSGDPSHEVISFPIDPLQNSASVGDTRPRQAPGAFRPGLQFPVPGIAFTNFEEQAGIVPQTTKNTASNLRNLDISAF